MSILIYRNGQQFGPYGADEVRRHLEDGNLSEADLGWYDGLEEWKALPDILSNFSDQSVKRTQVIRTQVLSGSRKNKPLNLDRSSELASISQKCKLTFYGIQIKEGLTKGEATMLIDKAKHRFSGEESGVKMDKHVRFWHDQVMSSDFVFAGEMSEPTSEMMVDTVRFLDESDPHWDEEMTSNEIATLLIERYPQLKK